MDFFAKLKRCKKHHWRHDLPCSEEISMKRSIKYAISFQLFTDAS